MSGPPLLPQAEIDRAVRAALEEDLGERGDLTSGLLVPAEARAIATIRAEEPLVTAGIPVARRTFTILDRSAAALGGAQDGVAVDRGEVLLQIAGNARALLAAERTALNFLGRMCGIAMATRRAVDRARGTSARIYDTRKTTPGLRHLEKYAVRCGGGENHRMGLHDMVLIKENHVLLAGGVGAAVRRARAGIPADVPLQVEVTSARELDEALAAGATLILLDNMSRDEMAAAVRRADGRARLEASGGIDPEEVGDLARATGVERISLGALTRSARWADVSMDVEIDPGGHDGG